MEAKIEGLTDYQGAAKLLGVSVKTVQRLAVAGELPSVTIGGSRRFDPQQLRDWWRARSQAPAAH